MCDLCVENRKVFAQELEIFTKAELKQHEVDGDRDGGPFKGHPLCEFCNKRMFDDNALWAHLRRQHFTCHICENQRQISNEFYANSSDLEAHFRNKHHLCEEEECLANKYIVFPSDVELRAHCASVSCITKAPRTESRNHCIRFRFFEGTNHCIRFHFFVDTSQVSLTRTTAWHGMTCSAQT